MITPMRIPADATKGMVRRAAIFALALLLGTATGVVRADEGASRNEALSWAFSNAATAFDRNFRTANEAPTRYPVCRVTSLRSRGDAGAIDFGIYIEESCEGTIRAELTLSSGGSIVDQLMRARLSDPRIDFESALGRLQFVRRELGREDARRILALCKQLELPVLPDSAVALDARTAEFSTRTGYRNGSVEFVIGDKTRAKTSTTVIIDEILRRAGSAYSLHSESSQPYPHP
jgi:hypothetical protein